MNSPGLVCLEPLAPTAMPVEAKVSKSLEQVGSTKPNPCYPAARFAKAKGEDHRQLFWD